MHINFALDKKIGKIAILKKHTETLRSLLKSLVFVKKVVIFTDYTLEHLVSHQKFTYHHLMGFLQKCLNQ